MKYALYALRVAVTLIVVVIAVLVAQRLWTHYELDPWTRDGRLQADVVQVSADVNGLVTDVDVHDNQPVKKGQLLFTVDRPRFQLALTQAEAAAQTQGVALEQARREDRRNRSLGDLVAAEATEQGASKVAQLTAALAQAQANRAGAALNLERTSVLAPMDGMVANVSLRPGDYAAAGRPVLGLVDAASLHVDGYFEETKLPRIHPGDPVEVKLMGETRVLAGHVDSISPGIVDRELGSSGNLLPNPNPTFSWVRLAQRIPVRVVLDRPPADVRLIAGRTATVIVHPRTNPEAHR